MRFQQDKAFIELMQDDLSGDEYLGGAVSNGRPYRDHSRSPPLFAPGGK